MKKLSQVAKVFTLGSALVFGSLTANAASISFTYDAATDGSGLTSQYIDPITGGLPGYFIETFDQDTNYSGFAGSTAYNDPGFDQECSVNSVNGGPAGVLVTPPSNEVGVRQGSVTNVAAAPANDSTCYAYLTNNGVGTASFEFDYSQLLSFNADTGITYLGFYWGSVDRYNDFNFYSGGNLVSRITGSGLLSALGGSAGNQTGPGSNVYVNIDFSFAEQFDRLVINTSGIAGEFDNIVVGLSQRPVTVSSPGSSALLLLGLAAIGLRLRRKK
ncbi:MAG: PEP-CTERM sorting domain-containing protein [Gammaproteobacteria bacterium]|nr:PEP-CTERM sorting domain-containing protein [Gammaproteobacteria bacterium]